MASNVELVNELADAFNRDGWDGLFPFLASDFEFHEPPEQPAPRTFRGHDEARAGWEQWKEAWAEQRSETVEVIELQDGRLLVLTVQRLRGRDGLELTQPSANIFTFKNGKVLRWDSFWERKTALDAAGIED